MRDIVIIFAVLLLLLVLISTLGGSIRYYNMPAPRVVGSGPYATAGGFPESFAEQEKERDTFTEGVTSDAVDVKDDVDVDAELEKNEQDALPVDAAQVEGFASRSSDYATV